MENLSHSIGNIYRNVKTAFTSIPEDSEFANQGTLLPKEFVEAGDFLVHRCQTWSWSNALPGLFQSYLPEDKQFLITRRVPCKRRASKFINEYACLSELPSDLKLNTNEVLGEGWMLAEILPQDNYEVIGEEEKQFISKNLEKDENIEDIDEIIKNDENAVSVFNQKNYILTTEPEGDVERTLNQQTKLIERTRTYNLSITYDLYYKTPRFWLDGYDEFNFPLKHEQIYEDILGDYAKKTATFDVHPCIGVYQLSIHPCKHAEMMKFLIDLNSQNDIDPDVNKSLIIFLKSLSAIVPTIEYDFTLDTNLRRK